MRARIWFHSSFLPHYTLRSTSHFMATSMKLFPFISEGEDVFVLYCDKFAPESCREFLRVRAL